MLLRLAHGEFFTKEKLHRFNLIDSSLCPRCDQIETLRHKFIDCDYVRRIWQAAEHYKDSLVTVSHSGLDPLKAAIGCYLEASPSSITLDAEILLRISYLRDTQNYLIHPNVVVKQCLSSLARKEKNVKIREDLKSLLED